MSEYVSNQLTHFAGRRLPDDESRYGLLSSILRSGELIDGRLINAPRSPIFYFAVSEPDGGETRIDFFPEPYFEIKRNTPAASDEAVRPEMVCFCDIPLNAGALKIHTSKYGRFGLAFDRGFLVGQGASPVTYIAASAKTVARAVSRDATSNIFEKAEEKSLFTSRASRGEYIGKLRDRHFQLVVERKEAAEAQAASYKRGASDIASLQKHVVESLDYAIASWAYIFGLQKRFDPALAPDHPDNYYMEREWRVLGRVTFAVSDIATIIIPAEFAERLRRDFPEFHGVLLEL